MMGRMLRGGGACTVCMELSKRFYAKRLFSLIVFAHVFGLLMLECFVELFRLSVFNDNLAVKGNVNHGQPGETKTAILPPRPPRLHTPKTNPTHQKSKNQRPKNTKGNSNSPPPHHLF